MSVLGGSGGGGGGREGGGRREFYAALQEPLGQIYCQRSLTLGEVLHYQYGGT